MRLNRERGAATVEHAGLTVLVAVTVLAAVTALAGSGPVDAERGLAIAVERRIHCSAAIAGPCWRDPLTAAYGRALAGAVRALAPAASPVTGPSGAPLVPVDFRRCRHESCAIAGSSPGHLTASNCRVTAFTSAEGTISGERITYWLYRPGLGWSREALTASPSEIEALAATPLLDSADPRLVPLETLDGRNHFDWAPGEQPPWLWQVASRYP